MTNWQERWELGQIGWHNSAVNKNLLQYKNILWQDHVHPTILVPLCGKSLDILWLAEQGASVIGVEMVEKAIVDFFTENALGYAIEDVQGVSVYRATEKKITIVACNFLDVSTSLIGGVHAIYDRASFVAIDPTYKQQYVNTCLGVLEKEGNILLLTYDSPATEMQGPPFPVKDGVIERLYANTQQQKLLDSIREEASTPTGSWSKTEIWHIQM